MYRVEIRTKYGTWQLWRRCDELGTAKDEKRASEVAMPDNRFRIREEVTA